ncbi:MAG: TonB-dependent receptor domain-containing protein [Steroidobacteraceae bacterium]
MSNQTVLLRAIALSVSLAAAPLAATAADSAGVVVTATRLNEELDESLASVTVIERVEIDQMQARTLDEILRGIEGITIARQGGIGQPTSLYMRGGESDHVLWLVDGVRIGSVSSGIPAIQDLPVDSIERIEIVRGVRSSLYGPDAMGGVVQIFTRRGAGASQTLRLTGGSNGTRQAALGFGGSVNGWSLDLQASLFETDGTNACLGLPFPPGGGCFTSEPDRDPYENHNLNARVGYQFASGSSAEAFVQRAEADVAFDGSFLNRSDLVNQVAGFKAQHDWAQGWRSTLTLGRSWDESTSFSPAGDYTSTFNSRRDSATFQTDVSMAVGTLVLGADWLLDRVASDVGFDIDSRFNRAWFAQYTAGIDRWQWGVSARSDDNEQFGTHQTGTVSVGYRPSAGWQWYASAGTAFKAPSFNELYYPGFSNPDLKPEKSRSLELGVKRREAWGRWSVSLYRNEVDDLVAYDVAIFKPNNVASALLQGAEGQVQWTFGAMRFTHSLSWLSAEDRSDGFNRGRELPRRPNWSGKTSAHWQGNDWSLGSDVYWMGQRYDDLANSRQLGGVVTVDLSSEWRLTPALAMQLRVANAFDRRYETATLYPALGREFLLSVRYSTPR